MKNTILSSTAIPGPAAVHATLAERQNAAAAEAIASHGQRPELPLEGFVRLRTVLAVFPVSASSWWRGIREGRYPRPVKLGPHSTGWKAADIRKLIEQIEREEAADAPRAS